MSNDKVVDKTAAEKKRSSSFKAWYEGRKEAFNKARKAKYAADPEAQRIARERQAARRAAGLATPKRAHNGYRVGEAARMAKTTPGVIAAWEARGMLPKQTIPSAHRTYTEKQVQLIALMAAHLKSPKETREAVQQQVHDQWEN